MWTRKAKQHQTAQGRCGGGVAEDLHPTHRLIEYAGKVTHQIILWWLPPMPEAGRPAVPCFLV